MNLSTGIEWTEATWNPIFGCYGPGGTKKKPNRCWYCYAEQQAKRQACIACRAFSPHIHKERLDEPKRRKKPTVIFVGSMCDMWGDWVPREWIESVLDVIRACPQHTFLALTKNPKRYGEFELPKNLCLGATVTNAQHARANLLGLIGGAERMYHSMKYGYRLSLFLSLEPLLDDVTIAIPPFQVEDFADFFSSLDCLIIGPLNKAGHGPVTTREMVENVTRIADEAGVPVFYKDALWKKGVMTKAEVLKRQQTPWGG